MVKTNTVRLLPAPFRGTCLRILLTSLLVLLGAPAGAAPSGWWNLSWRHSKWITVTAGSAAVPSGYSVPVTFNHSALVATSKSRADGNDIRVAYWNGTLWVELDRILDPGSSWNSATTTVWFKLQAGISASSSDNNYGLYYGNSGAGAPPTTGRNVFLFYDGFESGDLSAWDAVVEATPPGDDISATTTTVRTGTYAANATVDGTLDGMACVQAQYAAQPGVASVLYVRFPTGYVFNLDTTLNQFYGGVWGEFQLGLTVRQSTRQIFIWNNFDPPDGPYWGSTLLNTNQWYRLEMRSIIPSGRIELWVNSVREVNLSGRNIGTVNIDNNLVGIYWKPGGPNTLYVDDTFTRIWVDPEPTPALGTENVCCSSLQVTEPSGDLTVTAPNYFEMRFGSATGGGIDQFFDLAEDPNKNWDLAGGSANQTNLFADEIVQGSTSHWTGTSAGSGKAEILEATPTRTRVRQESYYRDPVGGAILPGPKATGDYSIYSSGRMAVRWNRKTERDVNYARLERNVTAHYLTSAPLDTWAAFSQSGVPPITLPNAASDEFTLIKNDASGGRTDFLTLLDQPWATVNSIVTNTSSTDQSFDISHRDTDAGTLTAGTAQPWDFLMYFKPTSFTSQADAAVTSRNADYQTPDALSAIAPGSGWNENTANGDFFNESEAAYTLDFDPANGLRFNMVGSMTRYAPFFKIRQWRSLGKPNSVTLGALTLTRDVQYKADVKPLARGYSAENLLWHCTLEISSSCNAGNLDIGSTGSTANVSLAVGKHGGGLLINTTTDYVAAGTAGSGDFSFSGGRVEFWYKPNYNHDDNNEHALWSTQSGTNCFYFSKTTGNALQFTIHKGGTSCTSGGTTYQVSLPGGAGYTWRQGDWVHLATEWSNGGQLKIFVDGKERAQAGAFDPSGMANGIVYFGGCGGGTCPSGTTTHADGVLDEIYIYNNNRLVEIGRGGLSDYLGSASSNYSFAALAGVDTSKRGNYLYFGADSKFRGLNVVLSVLGTGTSDTGMVWEYWNGTVWTSVPGLVDETKALKRRGTIYWPADPAGWLLYSLGGGPELYFVRAHLANLQGYVTPPTEKMIKTDILLFQYCTDITGTQTFNFGLPTPTAVELLAFEARAGDRAVELTWETAAEVDNLGFYLYRATSDRGPFDPITPTLIPGLGSSPLGARYRYLDSGLTNGNTYYYILEDVETSGKRSKHGPVGATPRPGSPPPAPPSPPSTRNTSSSSGIVYGEPEETSFRVIASDPSGVTLELLTRGFYAEPQADGTVRLSVPGFTQEQAIPVKRAWLDAVVGRKVRIASVRATDLAEFSSLRPSGAEIPEVIATRGVVVAGTRRASASNGNYADTWARLVSVAFQGESKKALVELSPLRWNGTQLVLARRLTVRVSFAGRELDERSSGVSRGRREPAGRRRGASPMVLARLRVRERGLYGVSLEDIVREIGRSVSETRLQLSHQREPVAYHLSGRGRGTVLYFVSEGASLNPYGEEAVYELTAGDDGMRMPLEDGRPKGMPAGWYWQRVERAENHIYQPALLDAEEPWFWDTLLSPVVKSYPFEVSRLASVDDPAHLELWLQGATDFAASPDHHVRVLVNGSLVAEDSWDGKTRRKLAAEIGPGILVGGVNQISIENVGDTGVSSMVMLERFAVVYPRLASVERGLLEGRWSESGAAEVQGLTGPAYVLDATAKPRWLTGIEPVEGGARFRAEAGRTYLVAGAESVLKPELSRPAASTLRSERNRAEYLVVGPQELLVEAAPLIRLRRSQGLSTKAVPLSEIYSEFGYGEERPEAIRDFLAYAYHHWARPSPRYVLLLGDATYDFKNYLGTGVKNQVPPFMTKTDYWWTASDPTYAAVNGEDDLPDLAIGRLPARTPEEARVLVSKIIAYETGGASLRGRAVLIADNADGGGDFEADANEIATSLPAGSEVETIRVSELGRNGTRTAIYEAFDRGASLMSYVGHGAILVWASENVFNIGDVRNLSPQEQQPFLLTMNCLGGYFHFPYLNSLSEELLKAPGRGAIGAFSPSGLSLNGPAHQYHKALLSELLSGKRERLGDAVLGAQAEFAEGGEYLELIKIYHLLGDPALRIR